MMYAIDRLNRLRDILGIGRSGVALNPVTWQHICGTIDGYPSRGYTPYLNDLDRLAGIDTRAINICGVSGRRGYVGARLARLERHVLSIGANYSFWLGEEGLV